MRVVVRESMSMDLLQKLISDIYTVTENLMNTESEIDLAGWQPFGSQSIEKQHGSVGITAKEKHKGKHKRGMEDGVHRAVC